MDKIIIDDVTYKIVSDQENELMVALINCVDSNCIIKNEVEYNNTIYKVTKLGELCIRGDVKTIFIPSNIYYISTIAFFTESLEEIIVDKDNKTFYSEDGCLIHKVRKYLKCCPEGFKIENYKIPEGVDVSTNAFVNCRNLRSVEYPNTEIYGSSYSFNNCENLETIYFKSGIYSIEANTVEDCPNLKNIYIPKGIKKFPATAFKNCPNLTIYCEDPAMEQRLSPTALKKYNIVFQN